MLLMEDAKFMAKKSQLPAAWAVPDDFHARLGSSIGRQRSMLADDHLLLVLHAPPTLDEDGRQGRFFWRDPDGKWSSSEGGNGMVSLERHLQDFSDRVDQCDAMEEAAVSSDDYFGVLNALAPVQRAARNLYDVLSEARKMVTTDRGLIDVRDEAYELVRRIDLLVGHTKTSMEYEVARRTEQQAQASHAMAVAAHRLNLLAAFFFPVATLSAVLGMNVPHGLEELPAPLGFFIVVFVGLICGLGIMSFLQKPRQRND